MQKAKIFILALFLTATLYPAPLFAHYLTVNADNYHPKVGESITISLGMGHSFPETTSCALEKMARMYILGPDGKEKTLEMKGEGEENLVAPVKVNFDKPGTYMVVAERKKGFVSKTVDGYKYKSKKELEDVIASYWSEGNAKAIINVQSPAGEAFKTQSADRYQVILDNDPGVLKKDDFLKAQVIYDGKPHKTTVLATYEGFAEETETYAYSTPAKAETPAKIRILQPGKWLVKVQDKFPYENTEEADQYSFTSSLTFEVK